MKVKSAGIVLFGLMTAASVHAGDSTGKVGQVVVGRMGNQVFIELQASQFNNWPCSTTHASGFRYAFLLNSDVAKAMLATVLTAQVSGQNLQVVGNGTCNLDSGMEDLHYVVLRP